MTRKHASDARDHLGPSLLLLHTLRHRAVLFRQGSHEATAVTYQE